MQDINWNVIWPIRIMPFLLVSFGNEFRFFESYVPSSIHSIKSRCLIVSTNQADPVVHTSEFHVY